MVEWIFWRKLLRSHNFPCLWPWCPLSGTNFCLPPPLLVTVFLHQQFIYSPRVLDNCGLTDGEATERLWSYLRGMAKMTKEMRPSHRIDILTSALLHYSSKICTTLGEHTLKLHTPSSPFFYLDSVLTGRLKRAVEVKRNGLAKLLAESGDCCLKCYLRL